MFRTSRYDQQAPYVVPVIPVSPQVLTSEEHTTHTHPNSNTTPNIPIAIATPLPHSTYSPNATNITSSHQPTNTPSTPSYTQPRVPRAERSVIGGRFDNHFQQRNIDNIIRSNNNNILRNLSQQNMTVVSPSLTRWKDHLFSCYHQIYPSCICSLVCPCVLVGDLTAKIQYMPFVFSFLLFITLYFIAIFLLVTQGGLGGALFTWAFLAMFVCSIRKKIRVQNQFRLGNDTEDCSNSCCCMYCVIAQMARHIFQYKNTVECNHYHLPSSTTRPCHRRSSQPATITTTTTRASRIPGRRGRNRQSSHTSTHNTNTNNNNNNNSSSSNNNNRTSSLYPSNVSHSELPSAVVTPISTPVLAQITHVEHTSSINMDMITTMGSSDAVMNTNTSHGATTSWRSSLNQNNFNNNGRGSGQGGSGMRHLTTTAHSEGSIGGNGGDGGRDNDVDGLERSSVYSHNQTPSSSSTIMIV